MQVSVENTSALERRMTVQVPEDKVKGEVDKRLDEMTKQARIAGFRPGKVPRKVVAQRFGRQVRDEVIGEMMQSSFFEALEQVLINLVSNARDAASSARKGEVTVRTRFASGLAFSAIRFGRAVRLPIEITITANGAGVDPAVRDQ